MDKTIKLWNVAAVSEVALPEDLRQVNAVAFSPDGSILATATRRPGASVNLWDLKQRTKLVTLKMTRTVPDIANRWPSPPMGRSWRPRLKMQAT